MGSEPHHQLHVFFFPVMVQGHMIPMVDIARLFAARGVKATIITTPLNAPLFSKTVDRYTNLGMEISIHIIPFPSVEAGLPEGCESINSIPDPKMIQNFFKALNMLQQPLEQLLQEQGPDCIVADMFLPWTTDAAAKFGIPRLVFHGTSFFSLCVSDSLRRYEPHKNTTSDTETFVAPGLPDQIELIGSMLPDYIKGETQNEFGKKMELVREADKRSYGILMNSFYELEPAYAEHYTKAMGMKAWPIGPVSLCNRDITDKAERGRKAAINEHECSSWLDSKQPNSVLYVCFGSVSRFSNAQLLEIAMALEASGHPFVWVVRKDVEMSSMAEDEEKWLPEGFEERMEGKGLIIRGWAPQMLILDHEATGGFMTHCGWNSTLEGISAGVPMVTWPLFAEQFYNEKLVTQVLRIGAGVGAREWSSSTKERKETVKREGIEKAVRLLMGGGEEAEQMRSRASGLGEIAKRAVEENGSSYANLTALIEELRLHRQPKT
ncbi:hypothetical protein HHK36_002626 [Tetracentron sinense]|uniref:Glycosyltransferase n=1 Tax=Tetracentron sinense TaxID=13715 RepID=A0A835DRA2_TETSI|nr:hypothetical protein HHK36_002626 [Tetracentron sinense]